MTNNNRPIDTIRDGKLKASIWENEGEKGPYFTTTLAKTYQDREGNLQDTQNFTASDLLRVSELARSAYHRSRDLRREVNQSQRPDNDEGRDEFKQSRTQNEGQNTKRRWGR